MQRTFKVSPERELIQPGDADLVEILKLLNKHDYDAAWARSLAYVRSIACVEGTSSTNETQFSRHAYLLRMIAFSNLILSEFNGAAYTPKSEHREMLEAAIVQIDQFLLTERITNFKSKDTDPYELHRPAGDES
ncbi:hypothetical protein CYMTET_35690 [Cymbomonas tetramitiformis]|uniref:Uncharacterized protein n=1 Tax=Cymbomonas tetramitiformis TaxID=36881 RepID=A0AAE0F8U5_9CHLO|nr:hypothetical protein CYMTET_35690 [Cymbomonas tetramitiformis]